jgi:uncharacterized 2Fe-2S/4Fe-4S cluster protein (DUF4445 family)
MTDLVHVLLEPLGRTLEVPRGSPLQDFLFGYGVEFPCGGQAACRGCRVRVRKGNLPVTIEQESLLTEREIADGWRIACRCSAESDLVLEVGQWEPSILGDESALEVSPDTGLGIAVDVGTTTLVAQLVDRVTGNVLGVKSGLNPQARHGADLMSRLEYALAPEGHRKLGSLVRTAVGNLIRELLGEHAGGTDVRRVTLVGNTAMHHLFCGLDSRPLAFVPFESDQLGAQHLDPGWLSPALPNHAEVLFLPCIGGFVGSDVLAGLLATPVGSSRDVAILVDLGTNGEVVVGNQDELLCASTAAGPAFEGARIRMGMQASTGAIARVERDGAGIACRVIGGVKPRGLCGSGLVDAVAAGLDLGVIEPGGRIAGGSGEWTIAAPVVLSQSDVRELQLAKAAIFASIRVLMERRGLSPGELPGVFLAGAFGNYVRRESALRIGLIPSRPDRIEPVGNAALRGARLALFPGSIERLESIRGRTRHLPLAADPLFMESYVESMAFPAG